jgi:hypothetical protein
MTDIAIIALSPPPERGRLIAQRSGGGQCYSCRARTPTRLVALADLPLSGEGQEKVEA